MSRYVFPSRQSWREDLGCVCVRYLCVFCGYTPTSYTEFVEFILHLPPLDWISFVCLLFYIGFILFVYLLFHHLDHSGRQGQVMSVSSKLAYLCVWLGELMYPPKLEGIGTPGTVVDRQL